MNYIWIFDLYMVIVDVYFWFKEKPCPRPVRKIVGSVPYLPLRDPGFAAQRMPGSN